MIWWKTVIGVSNMPIAWGRQPELWSQVSLPRCRFFRQCFQSIFFWAMSSPQHCCLCAMQWLRGCTRCSLGIARCCVDQLQWPQHLLKPIHVHYILYQRRWNYIFWGIWKLIRVHCMQIEVALTMYILHCIQSKWKVALAAWFRWIELNHPLHAGQSLRPGIWWNLLS